MMQIVYFSRKSQFLTEMQNISGEKNYITPSPAKADGLRSLLVENSSSDVVTIAKFTSELVKHLWEGSEPPAVKRKADLLLIFGILKNKYLPQLGYEQFTQAYNLFSDLRSFTLNEEALSTVMEEQSPEIRQAVELFWRLLDATGYLDEHGAYQKIAEALRSFEEKEELKKTYIFWGFQHLNGQQVDLLKALSIRYEVIIPFPLVLKEKLKKSDWLSWLREFKVKESDLAVIPQEPKASWLKVNSREIAMNLKTLMRPADQIVLGVSKLSPLHMDIVPSRGVFYKISHQLVQAELQELSYEIKSFMKGKELFSELEAFLNSTQKEIIKSLAQKKAFKNLKAIELYQDALNSIKELTDEEIKIDRFFLKLLHEVVALNQPRTSYVPVSAEELTIDLKDMSSLEDVKRDRRVILCVDDRFDEIQSLGQNYTEAIQKALSTLGPLKRNELELLFKQWEFHDLFSQGEVLVLMSESTLKHSLIWKRLFSDVQLIASENKSLLQERVIVDHLGNSEKLAFAGSFSASKFQTFQDCPRKFYFNYVDKIFPSVTLENDFDPMVKGTISHKIIEVFHKTKATIEELPHVIKKVMAEFIQEKKLVLTPETFRKHELEFNHRSLNGIQLLNHIDQLMGSPVNWSIEEDFSFTDEYKLTGKIDCIGRHQNTIFLLDFKSTKYGASSNKEVEQLESLQLWAYAKAAARSIENFEHQSVVLGFITLDNPSESNLLFTEPELFEKFKAAKICKQQVFRIPFPELFKSAQEKMLAVSLAIQAEKIYPARPRKSDACSFCELTKVCIKSEVTHE
ncbi:MAG: PD-(D/E)XK nuclease family protein [Bdellovibrionales bacterium]|nr:PD-(D/E)XK nuclease family protein [Bdellovibrionales bacterium]